MQQARRGSKLDEQEAGREKNYPQTLGTAQSRFDTLAFTISKDGAEEYHHRIQNKLQPLPLYLKPSLGALLGVLQLHTQGVHLPVEMLVFLSRCLHVCRRKENDARRSCSMQHQNTCGSSLSRVTRAKNIPRWLLRVLVWHMVVCTRRRVYLVLTVWPFWLFNLAARVWAEN